MNENPQAELIQWYEKNKNSYDEVSKVVSNTLKSLLATNGIDYLDVTERTKTLGSFLDKVQRKQYSRPTEQITDIAGIRIVLFIESDVNKACELIKSSFHVHLEETPDKLEDLGVDRTGYRSVHFVCDLGKERTRLPEFAAYKDIILEIQVRTILQHAWAEIEHDRNYKLSGTLPLQLQRRFYLLAGILEMVDREFDTLVYEYDQYTTDVEEKTQAGNLDIEISSESVLKYLSEGPERIKTTAMNRNAIRKVSSAIEELIAYGVGTIKDLDILISDDFLKALRDISASPTIIGFLRGAMMHADIDKYFSLAWKRSFTGFTASSTNILTKRYGAQKLAEIKLRYFGRPLAAAT